MICPKCKKSIPTTATICPYCGKKIRTSRISLPSFSVGKVIAIIVAAVLIGLAFTREETISVFGVSLTFARESIDKWCLIIVGVVQIIAILVKPLNILHPFATVALVSRFASEIRTVILENNIISYLAPSPFQGFITLLNALPLTTTALLVCIMLSVIISIVYIIKIIVLSSSK